MLASPLVIKPNAPPYKGSYDGLRGAGLLSIGQAGPGKLGGLHPTVPQPTIPIPPATLGSKDINFGGVAPGTSATRAVSFFTRISGSFSVQTVDTNEAKEVSSPFSVAEIGMLLPGIGEIQWSPFQKSRHYQFPPFITVYVLLRFAPVEGEHLGAQSGQMHLSFEPADPQQNIVKELKVAYEGDAAPTVSVNGVLAAIVNQGQTAQLGLFAHNLFGGELRLTAGGLPPGVSIPPVVVAGNGTAYQPFSIDITADLHQPPGDFSCTLSWSSPMGEGQLTLDLVVAQTVLIWQPNQLDTGHVTADPTLLVWTDGTFMVSSNLADTSSKWDDLEPNYRDYYALGLAVDAARTRGQSWTGFLGTSDTAVVGSTGASDWLRENFQSIVPAMHLHSENNPLSAIGKTLQDFFNGVLQIIGGASDGDNESGTNE